MELIDKSPYKASIGNIRLRLSELWELNDKAQKIREEGPKDTYEEIDRVLHHQKLLFVSEAIRFELISRHHNDLLAGHFGIDKTKELIGRKYYWPSLRKDVEAYIKGYDVCLYFKVVRHKPYGDLQSLLVSTHQWKDFSIDFVIGLPISTDWKKECYDSILVIVDRLIKMMHYELVKVIIDTLGLVEVIPDVVVRHHDLPDSIVTDRDSLFTLKFWSSLCYFLKIKQRLSTAFHP